MADLVTNIPASSVNDGLNNLIKNQPKSTGKDPTEVPSLGENFQDFIKILLVQLQNQDPNDPVDTKDMFLNFATLSQVANTSKSNQLLQKLVDANGAGDGVNGKNSPFEYLNKQVEVYTNKLNLSDTAIANGGVDFAFDASVALANANVIITDAAGKEVSKIQMQTAAGKNQFSWDGKNTLGTLQPKGIYNLKVEIVNNNGTKTELKPYSKGVVSGVNLKEPANPKVVIDKIDYALKDIINVQDAKVASDDNSTIDYASYLNKVADVGTDKFRLKSGNATNPFGLFVGESRYQYRARVLNATSGAEIFSTTITNATNGINQFTWNGKKNNSDAATDGVYQFKIDRIENGSFIPVGTATKGTIKSIDFSTGQPMVLVNDVYHSFANISQISIE